MSDKKFEMHNNSPDPFHIILPVWAHIAELQNGFSITVDARL